jgi:hypothetical protein
MRLSRSKIELFIECPRCFYADVKLKKKRPPTFPFTLNNAVDSLLKKEFDEFRKSGVAHPIQENSGFIPAIHNSLELWRNPFKGGISFLDEKQSCTYYGAIDDIWINGDEQFAVVDYKATAKETAVTMLPEWASSYARQLSFYSYLFHKNGYKMYSKGFLVYMTAITSHSRLASHLKFESSLIEVDLDMSWIEPTIDNIHKVLVQSNFPDKSNNCKYCQFIEDRMVISDQIKPTF